VLNRFLLIVFLHLSLMAYGQFRVSYGAGGVLPVGIATEYTFGRVTPELGIGVFGAWAGTRVRLGDTWYIGAAHGLQMIPSVGGWRSLAYISKSWENGNLKMSFGLGPRLDWFDRIPYPYPMVLFRVSKK
jgi:hypothetical protein